MIEDMTIRKLAPKTQHGYIQPIKNFAAFLTDRPTRRASKTCDAISCIWRRTAPTSRSQPRRRHIAVLLQDHACGRRHREHTEFIHEPRKLPVVLSPEEIARLLDAAPGLQYKVALSVAYGAGLRVSEVIALKIADVDSKRMVIRVEQGKGHKDRYVMLSPHLLELLRAWCRAARPQGWLFPGSDRMHPMTARQLSRVCHAAAQRAEIDKRVSPHTLGHSFATHLLERDTDIRVIQVLLGHAKLDTTALYTRVATKTIRDIVSPLDRITAKVEEGVEPPV